MGGGFISDCRRLIIIIGVEPAVGGAERMSKDCRSPGRGGKDFLFVLLRG